VIVVSDNGPLCVLVLIGQVELLPRLYDEVFLPPAVLREFRHPNTPLLVQTWAAAFPNWLKVRAPSIVIDGQEHGAGERAAIQLAKDLNARFLCDDRPAVNQARRSGLKVSGTLGVLQTAHAVRWIEIEEQIERLRTLTTMRLPEEELPEIIERAKERRAALERE
jgi:predicted nucleic acid-binding protein